MGQSYCMTKAFVDVLSLELVYLSVTNWSVPLLKKISSNSVTCDSFTAANTTVCWSKFDSYHDLAFHIKLCIHSFICKQSKKLTKFNIKK